MVACKASEPPPSTETKAAPVPLTMPRVAAAKVLSTKTPTDAYALETWCIDEANAAAQIAEALKVERWLDVRTIGTPPQLAIAAIKADLRFSAKTSSNPERCAGVYVMATVMRLN